jgi:hypothetical protein
MTVGLAEAGWGSSSNTEGIVSARFAPDRDADGIPEPLDNCPDSANATQDNAVHPATQDGDACYNPDGDPFVDADDNCPDFPTARFVTAGDNPDCDGFPANSLANGRGPETSIGTDPSDRCADTTMPNDETAPGVSPWPPDINDNRWTDLSDVSLMSSAYNKSTGQAGYTQRKDLNANGAVDLSDISLMSPFYNKLCTP